MICYSLFFIIANLNWLTDRDLIRAVTRVREKNRMDEKITTAMTPTQGCHRAILMVIIISKFTSFVAVKVTPEQVLDI